MEYWALVNTASDKEVEFSAWSLVGILRLYLDHHLRVFCQGHSGNKTQVSEELGIDDIDEAIKNIETDEALKQRLSNWIVEDTDYKILKGILTNPAPFPLKNVESQFVITYASGSEIETSFVTARNITDVKRALLAKYWRPNSYFYEELGLDKDESVLAVLVGIRSGKSFHKTTKEDIGNLTHLRGLSNESVIALVADDIIERLFDFAFTGGEEEQRGIPGHEWTTVIVKPFVLSFTSVYNEFNPQKYVECLPKIKAAGLDSDINNENAVDIVHMLDHALSSQRDTTHDVIRKAATTLILKHKAYLEMTFFNHPNTLSSALYDEELGLNSILRSCVIPYKDLVLTPEICQHVFETAVCNGITYHERVCGTRSFQDKYLTCNPLGGKCLITRDICAPKLCLNLEEANVLSTLLRFSAKEIQELDEEEEYTVGTIVRILN